MRSAILLLVFNRPYTTLKVFETIRAARPPRLYLAADGPRQEKIGELQLCQEVRNIVTQVDWPCEVFTLFRSENLGCKKAVSQAIDWFFEHEEEGIILEDDVLPLPSFFTYCDELLVYYRDNPNIAMIGGANFVAPYLSIEDSYFFSKYSYIWGWASWRRAWQYYDADMQDWPSWKDQKLLRKLADNNILFERYWRIQFDLTYQDKINTWDYQWMFICWKMGFLTVLPKTNLITNIGYDDNATHTIGDTPEFILQASPQALAFPLKHPQHILRNTQADKLINKIVYHLTFKAKFYQKYLNLLRRLRTYYRPSK